MMEEQMEQLSTEERQVKMTDKAVEEKWNKFVQSRRNKLAQLTGKANETEHLMEMMLM